MQKGYRTVTIDRGGQMWIQRAFKTPGGLGGVLMAGFCFGFFFFLVSVCGSEYTSAQLQVNAQALSLLE